MFSQFSAGQFQRSDESEREEYYRMEDRQMEGGEELPESPGSGQGVFQDLHHDQYGEQCMAGESSASASNSGG